jgi:hypothetical protein
MNHFERMMLAEEYKRYSAEEICKAVDNGDDGAIVYWAKSFNHWTESSEYWLTRYVQDSTHTN